MTSVVRPDVTKLLRRAAVRATRAPSVHNTQPWRFVVQNDVLEVHADHTRQLRVLDPRGRQLMISCGCAVFNARVALDALDCPADVERFPDPADPSLVARLVPRPSGGVPASDLTELNPAIDERHTNRRHFLDDAVPQGLVEALIAAAAAEGVEVVSITRPEHRLAVARLSQRADQLENADPAYRAELRAWTTDDPRRVDGVPAFAVPHVDGGAQDDVPIRDFDTAGAGQLPSRTRSSLNQCLLLFGSLEDNPSAWLRTGEALERVLLEIARNGYAASPLTQVVELAQTNDLLRHELGLAMRPHVLVRVGRAPRTSPTRRRRLVDMLEQAD
jgi:nitroreductase